MLILAARPAFCEDSAAAPDSEQQIVARRAVGLSKLPAKPVPPKIGAAELHPIDAFVAAKWPEAPAGPKPRLCDKATYLRRVYLDVIGAIPTWIETNRFLAGKDSQEGRENLVDQLLRATKTTRRIGRRSGKTRWPVRTSFPKVAFSRAATIVNGCWPASNRIARST